MELSNRNHNGGNQDDGLRIAAADGAAVAALADEIGGDVNYGYWMEEEEEQHHEMWLSDEEAGWARDLKIRVNDDNDIDPLTDMELAEHAIIAEGDQEEAIHRIKGLQQCREMYNVQDTVEEYVQCAQQYIRMLPGYLLSVEVSDDLGTSFMVRNFGAYDPVKAVASEQNWKTQIVQEYYLLKLQQPTLRSVREGALLLVDGHEMTWGNFSMDVEHRWNDELFQFAPLKIKRMMIYNCNVVVNLAWSMIKPFMRKEHRDCLKLGCTLSHRFDYDPYTRYTLSQCYLQPSFDVAMERLIQKTSTLLAARYRNSRNFRL